MGRFGLIPNLDSCVTASLTRPRHKHTCVVLVLTADRRTDLVGRPLLYVHPTISMTPCTISTCSNLVALCDASTRLRHTARTGDQRKQLSVPGRS
jgi:hypothetical protein